MSIIKNIFSLEKLLSEASELPEIRFQKEKTSMLIRFKHSFSVPQFSNILNCSEISQLKTETSHAENTQKEHFILKKAT